MYGSVSIACDDCGGKGLDVGSLGEPEPCKVCLGGGMVHMEFDARSSEFGKRKPHGPRASVPLAPDAAAQASWRGER